MAETLRLERLDAFGLYRVRVVESESGIPGVDEVQTEEFTLRLVKDGGTPLEQATAELARMRAGPVVDPAREAWERALARLRRVHGYVSLGVIPDNDPRLAQLRQTVRDGLAAFGNL